MNNINQLKGYANYNLHWQGLDAFKNLDPHLRNLASQSLIFDFPFNSEFPTDKPGVYLLTGGRQLGKSSALKQLILRLLSEGTASERIFFLPCDNILDRADLHKTLRMFLDPPIQGLRYLLIDEASYVAGWDLAIKSLVDEGLMRETVCLITGSDRILIEEAVTRLAGRRGRSERIDYEISPLTFNQFRKLWQTKRTTDRVTELFEKYLVCGGYPTAINDLYNDNVIHPATYRTYQDWIIGDLIRLGRARSNLMQILFGILNSYGSQVSFATLAGHTDGLSKDTIADYCTLLERLSVIKIQNAFDQNKLRGAPKKARKVHFLDPFILEAVRQLVDANYQPVTTIDESLVVESVCFAHLNRYRQTYYIKADGEVDLVYASSKKFFPIEIKWRKQIRAQDLKQIKKYKNGLVLALNSSSGSSIEGVIQRDLIEFIDGLPEVLPG